MKAVLPHMNEKQWQQQVIDLAHLFGYRTYHTYLSIRSRKGWPDLALFRPGRFLLVELKTDKGKVSAAQVEMLADLEAAGVECHIFRPSDFDRVMEVLK